MIEKHLTIKEFAGQLGISLERCRQLIIREPGVVKLANGKPGKREKATWRIPESVAERILRQAELR
jgi:hypothetical protein